MNALIEKLGSINLVAAAKTRSVSDIMNAVNNGIKIIAESRIQEAEIKYAELKKIFDQNIVEFHFIGHLQTNKAKKAVLIFDMIQSVHSLKLAEEINKRAGEINKIQKILIQVNIGREEQKHGVYPKEAADLVAVVSSLAHVQINGLMCMAPKFDIPEKTRPYFKEMKQLFDTIADKNLNKVKMQYLSMGMTSDYEIAIEEGSNMVRMGRGLFD